jgi:hypothetical protein
MAVKFRICPLRKKEHGDLHMSPGVLSVPWVGGEKQERAQNSDRETLPRIGFKTLSDEEKIS